MVTMDLEEAMRRVAAGPVEPLRRLLPKLKEDEVQQVKTMPTGPAPFGFRWNAKGDAELVPEEAPALAAVVKLIRAGGRGNKAIAGRLNGEDLEHRGRPWTAEDVAMIRRDLRSGRLSVMARGSR